MPSFVSTAEAWWSSCRTDSTRRGDLGVGQAVGYQGEDLPLATGQPGRVGPRGSLGAARHLEDRCRAQPAPSERGHRGGAQPVQHGHASSIGSGSPNSTSSSARSYGAPTAAQA
jgi:hypothetical protein